MDETTFGPTTDATPSTINLSLEDVGDLVETGTLQLEGVRLQIVPEDQA